MGPHLELHPAPQIHKLTPINTFPQPADCPIVKRSAMPPYELEVENHGSKESAQAKSNAPKGMVVRQMEEYIQQQDILFKECEHRLLNGLQQIASLLTIQSRAIENEEAAAQLKIAANRVATLGRVHQHLHALDQAESVEFKRYIEKLCDDVSGMATSEGSQSVISIEGIELNLPTATASPLAFIVSELLTNSIKYAKGRIIVRLEATSEIDYALSVSDDGCGLPKGFDPTATRGLGMKLISALVRQIGGELQIALGENGHGARFNVLFSLATHA
jgi:two-component sensor histidine kinase